MLIGTLNGFEHDTLGGKFIHYGLDILHIKIITNANKKNMPPTSPGVVSKDITYFMTILNTKSVIKMIGNAFVCLTYKSWFLTSYFVVKIKTKENYDE